MGKAGWSTGSSNATLNRQTTTSCRSPQGPVARQAVETLQRPGADIHLVMNTFNRMVGEPSIDGSAQCEQIFNLSDYLRLSLAHTVPAEVAIEQEIALLESYLRLASVFRGWALDHSVRVSRPASDIRLQAHSLCLMSHAVLCAYSTDSPGNWTLKVRLARLIDGVLAVDIGLQPDSAQPPARRRMVADALEALCRSMSRPGSLWRHAMRRAGKTGIAVRVFID